MVQENLGNFLEHTTMNTILKIKKIMILYHLFQTFYPEQQHRQGHSQREGKDNKKSHHCVIGGFGKDFSLSMADKRYQSQNGPVGV